MAKGKGSGKHATSKGERISSVSTKVKDQGQKLLNQLAALRKGRDIVLSLPNVGKDGKVHPNTKTKVNGKEHLIRMKNMNKGQKEVEA